VSIYVQIWAPSLSDLVPGLLRSILRFAACAIASASVISCAARQDVGTRGYLDVQDGFRDAKFGASPSSFENLHLVEQDEQLKCYRRSGDNLTLGPAPLTSIKYCFYKDRLASVILWTEDAAGAKDVLNAAYGEGQCDYSGNLGEGCTWKGRRVTVGWISEALWGNYTKGTVTFDSQQIKRDQENGEAAGQEGKAQEAARTLSAAASLASTDWTLAEASRPAVQKLVSGTPEGMCMGLAELSEIFLTEQYDHLKFWAVKPIAKVRAVMPPAPGSVGLLEVTVTYPAGYIDSEIRNDAESQPKYIATEFIPLILAQVGRSRSSKFPAMIRFVGYREGQQVCGYTYHPDTDAVTRDY
jgi:hypothetical protein